MINDKKQILKVPFKLWEASLACVGFQDVRFYLNGVHFHKDTIESTNGHVAYSCKISHDENWPDIIIKPVSNKPKSSVLNKSTYVIIETDGKKATIKYCDFIMRELDIQLAEVVDGKFPDLKKIKHKKSKVNGSFDIGFNSDYLAIPQELLKREKYGSIKMTAYDSNSACRIDILRVDTEEEYIYLMPVRL